MGKGLLWKDIDHLLVAEWKSLPWSTTHLFEWAQKKLWNADLRKKKDLVNSSIHILFADKLYTANHTSVLIGV